MFLRIESLCTPSDSSALFCIKHLICETFKLVKQHLWSSEKFTLFLNIALMHDDIRPANITIKPQFEDANNCIFFQEHSPKGEENTYMKRTLR